MIYPYWYMRLALALAPSPLLPLSLSAQCLFDQSLLWTFGLVPLPYPGLRVYRLGSSSALPPLYADQVVSAAYLPSLNLSFLTCVSCSSSNYSIT